MTTFTASSELDPEGMFPQTNSLFEASGSNLPTPLTGWDVLPPPSRPPRQVARLGRGRRPGRQTVEGPLPLLSAPRSFTPPFRIG